MTQEKLASSFRAPLAMRIRYSQFMLDNGGREPSRIRIHPRTWVDVLDALEGYENGWFTPTETGWKFLNAEIVEDLDVPGIEMLMD